MRVVRMLLGLILMADSMRADEKSAFVFTDVGADAGLLPAAAGIRGHAAAWGDAFGDGFPSLFIGTFHEAGSKPSMLLRNVNGKFQPAAIDDIRIDSCASGGVFVDLTNNGRLDLFVSNSAHGKEGPKAAPSALFRNEGNGRFTDISKQSGACPEGFMGRTVAALDFNGDGLLDLLCCDFYYSTKCSKGIALYRNLGNHHFEDVAEAAGLPRGAAISGCAVCDLNGDGWPDIFLVSPDGNNRLYLNDGHGAFHEAPGTRDVFAWKGLSADNPPTGVCIADVNGDGLPDIVIGHHFKLPWLRPAPIRLYLNRGIKDGSPTFEEVTEAAGLMPLSMKAPYVDIQDFDNDGRPDIFVSIVKFKDGRPYPLIYHNQGQRGGIPKFVADGWDVNDFPTDQDKIVRGTTAFFAKMLADKKVMYTAAAPTADFDRDGKLDIFMVNWWIESNSLLLKNQTPGGHWIDVQMLCDKGVNRMGIGSVVRVYPAGKGGDATALLASREMAVGYGWCSGQEASVHLGLGSTSEVDVEVTLPHGKGVIVVKNVKADHRLTVRN